jgi:hypothetical protein
MPQVEKKKQGNSGKKLWSLTLRAKRLKRNWENKFDLLLECKALALPLENRRMITSACE